MNARQKLNQAAINGCLVVAALIGFATASWIIFFVALGALIASALSTTAIRPGPRKPGDRHRH